MAHNACLIFFFYCQSWVGAATDAYQVDRNEIVALQGYDSAEEECEYVDHTYEVVLGRNVQEIDSFADF